MKPILIFLDIDGVLNNESSGTMYTVAKKSEDYAIDENNFNTLKKIFSEFEDNVKVVVHSGWIKYQDNPNATWETKNKRFTTLLPSVITKLGKFYIGCVDYFPKTSKKFKILKWLEKHSEYDSWLKFILDDDESDYTGLNQIIFERRDIIFCPINKKYGLQQQTVNNLINTVKNS